MLIIAAVAPAAKVPLLMPVAQAQVQDIPAFQDVPRDHWAYAALQKLAASGIVEGYSPSGNYRGQQPMTRYEFAVAVARFPIRHGVSSPPLFDSPVLYMRLQDLGQRPIPDITRAQINDLISALQREFRDEIARLGGRVETLETRVSALENRVEPPPRLAITPSILHRTGIANYIDNSRGGRTFLNPTALRPNPFGFNALIAAGLAPTIPAVPPFFGGFPAPAFNPTPRDPDSGADQANKKFSYSDVEIRLTDRVSDGLSISAALRSLGSNQEDPWAGDSRGGVYLREGFASADLSRNSALGIRGLSATLGRQRTKIAQGLLYDNDFSPTDQLRADFNLGPLALTGFVGTTNNQAGLGTFGVDPYVTQGAVFYMNTGIVGNDRAVGFPGFGLGAAVPGGGLGAGNLDIDTDFDENSFSFGRTEDNESLIRASANLFRIGSQPVNLGYTRLLDGFRRQKGDSLDLTVPLFGRTLGVEYVRSFQTAFGARTSDNPNAFIATVPLLRTKILDLNAAYGQADDDFVYNVISSANPYARSYGEALFDRPIALGAPMMTDLNGGGFLAAKRTFDVKGTLRIPLGFLKRVPLNFRFYRAKSGANLPAAGVGTQDGGSRQDLGRVYSLGSTFNVTPGLSLNVLGGIYNPKGDIPTLRYMRVGASVGF
ncbi:MAG TPA: S-layer homology domain-containing protein [Abditibacterium sp.]